MPWEHCVRTGRVPDEIKKAKFKKESVAVYKDKLKIVKWKDKKDICLLRSTHGKKLVQIF
jgi:hypothetical protein